MRRRERVTYHVKTYHCKECGHIFHHTNPDFTKCRHCRGELEIIDRYKSSKAPRGSPPRGKPWQVKGGVDKSRRLKNDAS